MRSSKSRSRSKSNRQRSLGNIINRVFDSSGPEGKVRGTPQQIIDKYLMLARDAQLSNDRVAEQNFLQHAEHYTRMLGEAQREMQREQELRQSQNPGQGNGNMGGQAQGGHPGGQPGERGQNGRDRYDDRQDARNDNRGERGESAQDAGYVFGEDSDEGPGLVETPETRDEARAEPANDVPEVSADAVATPEPAAEPVEAAPQRERGPRGPRRPREKREDGEGKRERAPREKKDTKAATTD